jgi:hypothetical protein
MPVRPRSAARFFSWSAEKQKIKRKKISLLCLRIVVIFVARAITAINTPPPLCHDLTNQQLGR